MGCITSEEVSFDDFEELDVDEIIVVVVAAVVFMLDVVGAPAVSLLVMFEAPPALEGITNPFHYFHTYISVFFKFLSSRSFVKSRRLWVHLLDIFRLVKQ